MDSRSKEELKDTTGDLFYDCEEALPIPANIRSNMANVLNELSRRTHEVSENLDVHAVEHFKRIEEQIKAQQEQDQLFQDLMKSQNLAAYRDYADSVTKPMSITFFQTRKQILDEHIHTMLKTLLGAGTLIGLIKAFGEGEKLASFLMGATMLTAIIDLVQQAKLNFGAHEETFRVLTEDLVEQYENSYMKLR